MTREGFGVGKDGDAFEERTCGDLFVDIKLPCLTRFQRLCRPLNVERSERRTVEGGSRTFEEVWEDMSTEFVGHAMTLGIPANQTQKYLFHAFDGVFGWAEYRRRCGISETNLRGMCRLFRAVRIHGLL